MRKFRWDGIGCKVLYDEELPNIKGNAQIFNHIHEEVAIHIYDFAPNPF
jgi:hypothetical protein